jgi:hypothetical protein
MNVDKSFVSELKEIVAKLLSKNWGEHLKEFRSDKTLESKNYFLFFLLAYLEAINFKVVEIKELFYNHRLTCAYLEKFYMLIDANCKELSDADRLIFYELVAIILKTEVFSFQREVSIVDLQSESYFDVNTKLLVSGSSSTPKLVRKNKPVNNKLTFISYLEHAVGHEHFTIIMDTELDTNITHAFKYVRDNMIHLPRFKKILESCNV